MSNATDNPQIEVLKAGGSGVFTNYIYKAIPLAFDESMSYYETLAGLRDYLEETVIPTVNNNAEAVAELQSLYEELNEYVTNYFDNLDVQEEINNKLDDLVRDGTLTRLIGEYVQPYINAQNQEIANFKTQVNNQISQQNAQIQAVESGSPLVATSVSEMTNTSRVYVNTTDGYWYYYDGTEWQQGGVYQSSVSVSDSTLSDENMVANSKATGVNIDVLAKNINVNNQRNSTITFEQGTLNSSGQENDSQYFIRTEDYILCRKDDVINILDGYKYRVFLFSGQLVTSLILRTDEQLSYYKLPYNCYIRITISKINGQLISPSDSSNLLFNISNYKTTEYFKETEIIASDGLFKNGNVDTSINNHHFNLEVNENEIIKFNASLANAQYKVINILDNENNVIQSLFTGNQSNPTIENQIIVMPPNAKTLIINSAIAYNTKVQILSNFSNLIEEIDDIKEEIDLLEPLPLSSANTLNISCCNVGKFSYGTSEYSENEYLENWKKMINDSSFDIFGLCEWTNNYSQDINSQVALFDSLIKNHYTGDSNNLNLESRLPLEFVEVLELTSESQGITSSKYKVLKCKTTFNEKNLYIYMCHLTPSPAGANLRALQFQDLIDDVEENNIEYAIFIGDFNAQNSLEYDVFKNANYNMANCDYIGEIDTLRDIPADNIISTPNIAIKKFELIDTYPLNTDHKPLKAEIYFKN